MFRSQRQSATVFPIARIISLLVVFCKHFSQSSKNSIPIQLFMRHRMEVISDPSLTWDAMTYHKEIGLEVRSSLRRSLFLSIGFELRSIGQSFNWLFLASLLKAVFVVVIVFIDWFVCSPKTSLDVRCNYWDRRLSRIWYLCHLFVIYSFHRLLSSIDDNFVNCV